MSASYCFGRTLARFSPVVALVAWAACTDPGPADPVNVRVSLGSVRLTITTSGIRPDSDGYTVSVDGSGPRPIPSNGSLLFEDLAPGSHAFELTDMARHCVASAGNPFSLTVAPGSTIEATLDIECGYLVYVSNVRSSSISVIETVTNTVVATLPIPSLSQGIAVTPDWQTVYYGTPQLGVLNTESDEVLANLPDVNSAFEVVMAPDGASVYVASLDGNLYVVETQTHSLANAIPVGPILADVAVSSDSRWAYASDNQRNGRVYRVDLTSGVSPGYRLLSHARWVVASPVDERIYVGLHGRTGPLGLESEIHEVERTRLATVRSVSVSGTIGDFQVSPDGTRLYVPHDDQISVLDTDDLTEVGRIPVLAWPLALTGDGATLYGCRYFDGEVVVISTNSLEVIATIPVGERPRSLAITPP